LKTDAETFINRKAQTRNQKFFEMLWFFIALGNHIAYNYLEKYLRT